MKLALALILAAAMPLAGCYTVQTRLAGKVDRRPIQEWQSFYLWGLVGEKLINVDDYCAKGAAKIQDQTSAVNGILYFITLGIYAPRTMTIHCRL